VRGNTSRQIVKIARQMGAAKVYLALLAAAAVPVSLRHRHVDQARVRRARPHHEEIAKELGADHVLYQTIEEMVDAVRTAGNVTSSSARRASKASTRPATSPRA
jgi:amidophosphoribosyltransferase